jgi:hypothetical protein
LPAFEVLSGEGTEFGGVFANDDLGSGIEAGFEGVGTGSGFTIGGARAGGFLCVAAVGRDLFRGTHLPGIADREAGVRNWEL